MQAEGCRWQDMVRVVQTVPDEGMVLLAYVL